MKNTVELYDRAHTLAESATPGTTTEQIENILKLCIELSKFDRDRVFTTLARKLHVGKNQMMALFKVVEARSGQVEAREKRIEDGFVAWFDRRVPEGLKKKREYELFRACYRAGFEQGDSR